MDKENLAKVLEHASDMIQNTDEYGWYHVSTCNCGMVARAALMRNWIDDSQLCKLLRTDLMPTLWENMAMQAYDKCSQTGEPLSKVFAILHELGFRQTDYHHLENLSDQRILKYRPSADWLNIVLPGIFPCKKEDGTIYIDKQDMDNVILYLRTWAEMLRKGLL